MAQSTEKVCTHSKPFSATITNAVQTRSLLDLPAEIWSKIGKHAIEIAPSLNDNAIDKTWIPGQYSKHDPELHLRLYQPPITKVCRVMRDELLAYYYQTKISVSWSSHLSKGRSRLIEWLKAIGHINRHNVRGLFFWCLTTVKKSHEWPKRRFKRELRTKCGIEVALHEEESTDGHTKYRVEILS